MRNLSTIPPNNFNTKRLTFIGLATAVLCILSPFCVVIPFSPVPISLSTLAIYLLTAILGIKSGTISVLLYILLGFCGLPVFSGFVGGPSKLFGPTGGYIFGYIFLALICGYSADKFIRQFTLYFTGLLLGTGLCYCIGTFWLSFQLNLSLQEAFIMGVLPYLPADFLKIIVAALLGRQIRQRLYKSGLVNKESACGLSR